MGKKDPIGFQEGDKVNTEVLGSILYDGNGYPIPQGTTIEISLKRDQKTISLPYIIEHKKRKYKHRLLKLKEPSQTASNYFAVWKGQ